MKHKVSELTGALLDAAVAKAEGFPSFAIHDEDGDVVCYLGPVFMDRFSWCPSSAWEQGGPVIERERVATFYDASLDQWEAFVHAWRDHEWMRVGPMPDEGWRMGIVDPPGYGEGPTLLIAAMRAYVASKFGDEVELP